MSVSRLMSSATSSWGIPIIAICLTTLAGFLVSAQPIATVPLFGSIAALILFSVLGPKTEAMFLCLLSALLFGFMLQSKAFAYIGIYPFYISEVVLTLGLVSLVFTSVRCKLTLIHIWLIALIGLGLIHTIPYISHYGINAVRDAAFWYYSLFAILVSFFVTRQRLHTFIRLCSWALPILIIWFLILPILTWLLPETLPHFPNSPVPILYKVKSGDRAVILVGLGVLLGTGLYQRFRPRGRIPSSLLWIIWIAAASLVAISGRSGLLAMSLGLGFAILTSQTNLASKEWWKAITIGCYLLALLLIINPRLNLDDERLVSSHQLITNVTSIFSDNTDNLGNVQNTKKWRLNWWEDIWDYTVHGDYFWTGKGFGINLASDDGYQVSSKELLRSPHSSHMTVLARMGVPGLLTWITLNFVFAFQMLHSIWRSSRTDYTEHAQVKVWLFTIWIAAMVNSSFDVYLEGPQGAIIFWSVFGAGIAAMRFDAEAETISSANRADQGIGVLALHANPSRS